MIHWSPNQSRSFFEESGGRQKKKSSAAYFIFAGRVFRHLNRLEEKNKNSQAIFFFVIVILIASVHHFEKTLVDFPMKSCKF